MSISIECMILDHSHLHEPVHNRRNSPHDTLELHIFSTHIENMVTHWKKIICAIAFTGIDYYRYTHIVFVTSYHFSLECTMIVCVAVLSSHVESMLQVSHLASVDVSHEIYMSKTKAGKLSPTLKRLALGTLHVAVLVVNYGISNTIHE